VRDTRPLDTGFGLGIAVQYDVETRERAEATIRSSLIEETYEVGVLVDGSIARLEGTLVRGTNASASGLFGRGLNAQDHINDGHRSDVEVDACVFERGQEVGLYATGSDVDVHATVVRDTRAKPDGQLGVGVDAELSANTGQRALLTLRDSLVERNQSVGVFVISADVAIAHSVVRDTVVEPFTALFGDGITVLSFFGSASASVDQSLIEANARAGMSNFGGALEISNSALQCNAVDLNGELWEGTEFAFNDRGGNRCGCNDSERICRVLSTSLTPPDPPDRTDAM